MHYSFVLQKKKMRVDLVFSWMNYYHSSKSLITYLRAELKLIKTVKGKLHPENLKLVEPIIFLEIVGKNITAA